MLNKILALVGTCILSLSVHAEIYHFNGVITDVTGPDVTHNVGDQFNFTIEIDLQSPGYRTIGASIDFLTSTDDYTYYAAEYISGDAVENVAQDSFTNHYYIEYEDPTFFGSAVISVLNNLDVFTSIVPVPQIGSWNSETNIGFAHTWRNDDLVSNLIQGQITSFTVDDDSDSDGVDDNLDNCTLKVNTDQRDSNGDGFGNACDPDIDNNGVVNFADISAWVPLFNTACGDVDEDFDGSGTCNFGDFALFPEYFLMPPGPSGIAP